MQKLHRLSISEVEVGYVAFGHSKLTTRFENSVVFCPGSLGDLRVPGWKSSVC